MKTIAVCPVYKPMLTVKGNKGPTHAHFWELHLLGWESTMVHKDPVLSFEKHLQRLVMARLYGRMGLITYHGLN
jgi:hypothetical protein